MALLVCSATEVAPGNLPFIITSMTMNTVAKSEEFSRLIAIEPGGFFDIEADADECKCVCRRLGLLVVSSLVAKGRVVPQSGGSVILTLQLRAEVEQACVVTLDPVPCIVEEKVEVTYVPESEAEPPKSGKPRELDVNHFSDDQEPLVGTEIDVGAVVAEHLGLALDPYPRKPEAVFEAQPGSVELHPFAALKALKPGN